MKPAAKPRDEKRRLAELQAYQIPDAPTDAFLDDLATTAALVCATPISGVSLVHAERQFFKAKFGWDVTETPRDHSFCAHTIRQQGVFIVPDALEDARFTDNPLVISGPKIRFYAGAPLISPQGLALGAICVIDQRPRQLLNSQIEALQVLSRQVMVHLDLQRRNVNLEKARRDLQATEERLRFAFEGSEEGVWDWNLESGEIFRSERWSSMLGYQVGEVGAGVERWKELIHPDDWAEARARANAHLEGRTPSYASEHRVRAKDGSYRWILDRGKVITRADDGKPLRFVGTHTDVTSRKKGEEVSSRLNAIVESSQDAIIGKDLDGLITHWNKGAEKIFGFTAEEMMGGSILKIIPEERQSEEIYILGEVRAGRRIDHYQTVRQRKDGTGIDVSVTVSPIKDPAGHTIGVSKVARDITKEKASERQIHNLNRIYSLLSSINQTIVREKNPQAVLSTACEIAVEKGHFALAWVGLLQKGTNILLPVASAGMLDGYIECVVQDYADPARSSSPMSRALRTSEPVIINDVADAADSPEWQEQAVRRGFHAIAAFPLKVDGKLAGAIGLYSREKEFFDETEEMLLHELASDIGFSLEIASGEAKRREFELALRASERQFASAFEFAAIGKALVAPDGRWLKVNRALCQMLGYSAEEFLKRTFQEITHPEDLAADLDNVHKVLEGEQDSYQMEKRYIHKDGHYVWALLSVSLVRNEAGRPLHFISELQDLSERRKIEEQFRQAQKMEAIGQLAGGVAHDFNNILAAIMMQADIAALEKDVPKTTLEMLNEINASAQRAANLTHQLLAFSRRQVMQQQKLDLNHVVESMAKMLRRVLGEEVQLHIQLGQAPLPTRADAGMLDQVLLNLVVNARDAMPKGGRLTIETSGPVGPEAIQTPTNLAPGRYIQLVVSDTGEGIPVNVLPHIFEPFFTTKEPGKGTGLGLATVFGIVQQHSGAIFVGTEIGRGTRFQILLPMDESEAALPAPTRFEPGSAHRGELILVVEDDLSVRMLTCTLLERAGYRVLDASNGVDAVNIWHRHQEAVDLLLTDMVMPEGMNGRDVAAKLRGLNPSLKVIFTSGYSPDIAGKDFTLGPGEDFLQKPCPAPQFLKTVRRALDA